MFLKSRCSIFLKILDVLTTDGDILLGGLFPIHKIGSNEKECGLFNEIPGYHYMEAMLYAIDKINVKEDILPGIKLGAIIYDTCRSPTISADKTKLFIKSTLTAPSTSTSEFAGVIGAFKSGNSVIVANLLRVFSIPQISYGSLTVKLSNKDVFNYFFRTVPPDSFFAAALTKFLERMKWTYVSIVYSTGTWSETGAQEVKDALTQSNICIAYYLKLIRFPHKKDFDDVIQRLVSDGEQPTVVILVTIQRDSNGLLKAKKRNRRSSRLTFVGSLEWSNRGDITKDLGEMADGTITFGHQEKPIPEFERYFQSLHFNNYKRNNNVWIGEYWQETHQCKLQNFSVPTSYTANCSGDERNTKYKELAPVQVVINAVQAMAKALDGLQRHLCPGTVKMCNQMRPLNRTLLLEFLRNVTFEDAAFHYPVQFNARQEVDGNYTLYNFRWNNDSFDYLQVGSWVSKLNPNGSISGTLFLNQSKVRWANGSKIVPLSTCRPGCRRNEVSFLKDLKCCWECKSCNEGDVIINNTCHKCAEGFIPNKHLSSCLKLSLKYVNMDNPLAILLILCSALGILATVFVFAVFFANREHRLIKASGREMCYFMFLGICVIFMIPLFFLKRPTYTLCFFRVYIMSISFTLCYAPLLMKMWRIHTIFKSAKQLRRLAKTSLVSSRPLFIITVGLIAVQVLLCATVHSIDPPKVVEKYYFEKKELVLECTFKTAEFSVNFIYNVVLLFCCTFYAFRTRHFPKNFNEAMHIGITMYLTCAVWIVFIATFLNVDNSISRVYCMSWCSLVVGWVTLVGLFGPKLYQLYTKKEFSREMLLTWGDSLFPTEKRSVDISAECLRCKIRDHELRANSIVLKLSLTAQREVRDSNIVTKL